MRWNLRNQLLLPLLCVALLSLALAAVAHGWLAARRTRDDVARQLQGVTDVLRNSNFPLTRSVLRQMRGLCGAEFVLVDSAGRLHASSWEKKIASLPEPLAASSYADEAELGSVVEIGGETYFHSAVRLDRMSPANRGEDLHIFFPRRRYLEAWRQAFVPPLVVAALAIVAAAVAATTVARRLSRSMQHLGAEVQRIAEGDHNPLELPRLDDEIRDLSVAVNRAAQKLDEFEQQIRFAERTRAVAMIGAGLAHELRNSATGCRLALDLHEQDCPSGERESLAVARRQLAVSETLLQRLLQFGKASQDRELRPLAWEEVVEESLSLIRPAARHAGVQLTWTPPAESVVVRADKAQLSQAVANLLINAIEAAQRSAAAQTAAGNGHLSDTLQAAVTIALSAGESTAQMIVADTGPGVPDGLAASVFEPFATSKPEGAGLGLAVTKQTIESAGGTLSWKRRDGRTFFCIDLPRAANPAGE